MFLLIDREEAAQRIQALTDKAEKDNQQHNIEMKELVRLIDHDRKLKQFMKIKAAEREEDPQLTAWKVRLSINKKQQFNASRKFSFNKSASFCCIYTQKLNLIS